MTDHKFTDEEEEVINVLCFYVDRQCNNCDIDDSACCVCCINTTIRDALTLINRQKAEIEEKSKDITFAAKELIRLDRERSEVIKEFAQRLKADIVETGDEHGLGNSYPILTHNYIDTLVKEMTEGNHESQST